MSFLHYRTVLRFVLLFKFEAGMQPTPPVSPANRELLTETDTIEEHDVSLLVFV